MAQTVKGTLRTIVHSSGALHAVRGLKRRAARILMYHHFSDDTTGLKEQCRHIRRYYHPVTLSEISHSIQTGESLPPNALAITVDDGYRDFFLHAYPVFRDFEIPSTLFLVSDFVDKKSWLWWNEIEYAIHETDERSLTLEWPQAGTRTFSLETPDEKLQAIKQIVDDLMMVENTERMRLVALIPGALGVKLPAAPPSKWESVSWAEAKQMIPDGVELGAHTKSHPILSQVREADVIREEIEGSKQRIEQALGQPVLHFCYPNGSASDINPQTVDAVRQAGFLTAVTTERGLNFKGVDPFLLRRVGVEPEGATPYFQELLAGLRAQ